MLKSVSNKNGEPAKHLITTMQAAACSFFDWPEGAEQCPCYAETYLVW